MRPLLNKKTSIQLTNNQGFTLIEILVALVLIALVLAISISNPLSSRDDLEKEVNGIERAIRFMSDEAVLKNAVIRLHLILEGEAHQYAVEYGPSDSFILPPVVELVTQSETKEEEKQRAQDTKNLNMKFNKVIEFQEKNNELNSNIKIIGVGTPHSDKLQSSGEVSIYAFPSGEKDAAIILIASDEDIMALKIDPFRSKIARETTPLGKGIGSEKELTEIQLKKAQEIFEKWKKEN